jgi:transcriptional regulator with XRE-family HTH domain
MKTSSTFGEWVRRLRMAKGLTQTALAKAVGFKYSQSIANIERGVAPFPVKYAKKFCQAVGITEAEMVSRLVQEFQESLQQEMTRQSRKKAA